MKLSSVVLVVGFALATCGIALYGGRAFGHDTNLWSVGLTTCACVIMWAGQSVKDLGDKVLRLPKLTVPRFRDMTFLHVTLISLAIWAILSWTLVPAIVKPEWKEEMPWAVFFMGIIISPCFAFALAICGPNAAPTQPQSVIYLSDLKDYERETIRAICAADPRGLGTYSVGTLYQAWCKWSRYHQSNVWLYGTETNVRSFIMWAKTRPIDPLFS